MASLTALMTILHGSSPPINCRYDDLPLRPRHYGFHWENEPSVEMIGNSIIQLCQEDNVFDIWHLTMENRFGEFFYPESKRL